MDSPEQPGYIPPEHDSGEKIPRHWAREMDIPESATEPACKELEQEGLSDQVSGVEGEVSPREWARLAQSVPESERGVPISPPEPGARSLTEEDAAIRAAVHERDTINPLRHPIKYHRASQKVRREFVDWN